MRSDDSVAQGVHLAVDGQVYLMVADGPGYDQVDGDLCSGRHIHVLSLTSTRRKPTAYTGHKCALRQNAAHAVGLRPADPYRVPVPVSERSRRSGSPVLLVLIGILSVQFGAGIAKSLFDEVAPTTLVWLRLAASVLILLVVVRPQVRGRTRADWLVVLAFGAALGAMNWAIYQSFARIPLGIAVTIEFLGPLTLAVIGSRRPRDLVWVVLAAAGVALLGFDFDALTWAGVGFALLAGAAWAAYILLSAETGQRWAGLDGLVLASAVATVILTPYVVGPGRSDLDGVSVLLVGAAVGLLSSVIPYSCELVALRSLRPAVFGILMSLEPAAAAVAGLLILGQRLGPVEVTALVLVSLASAGVTLTRRQERARVRPVD
jgi:inner membrane transporter RhtA